MESLDLRRLIGAPLADAATAAVGRPPPPGPAAADPFGAWAASGAMALTGRSDGPPQAGPHALPELMELAASWLEALSRVGGHPVVLDGPALLGERAALAGLARQGRVSCGDAARLMRTADGWLAVNLARPEDEELVPAWLALADGVGGAPGWPGDPWGAVEATARRHPAAVLAGWARLCGLAVSVVGEVTAAPAAIGTTRTGPARSRSRPPVVVDLSSLWAGPLCAQLLGAAGARVIKVESTTRPDGARLGPPAFFDLLHAGHQSVALDFASAGGRADLARLVTRADVVIEGSRPRALRQLGLGAEDVMAAPAGPRAWLSITGYGRGADADRVAYGDDAAAAAGLVVEDAEGLCFCADAAADPATGLVAAVAVLAALATDGRWVLDAAMARVAAAAASPPAPGAAAVAAPPRSRPVRGAAPPSGTHTDRVRVELGAAV